MGQIYKNIPKYVPRLGKVEGSLVEIGASRPGDNQSTQYLYDLAKSIGTNFITCDINVQRIRELNDQDIPAVCNKGEDFLPTYEPKVSIAYLDNFDWNWHPMATEDWTLVQIEEYREKYQSLFLCNYRESKDIARKRISFDLIYDICGFILEDL